MQFEICNLKLAIWNQHFGIGNLLLSIYNCLLSIDYFVVGNDIGWGKSPVSVSIRICHDLSRSVKIYLDHLGPIGIHKVQVPSPPKVALIGI